jgi:hypothetical protein
MPPRKLTLTILPGRFAICRLPAAAPIPDWATQSWLVSITRTADELSVMCEEANVPPAMLDGSQPGPKISKNWRALKLEGPFDFSEVGVLASVITPLADAGISISAVSTFDTDYLFVRGGDLQAATKILAAHGHTLRG